MKLQKRTSDMDVSNSKSGLCCLSLLLTGSSDNLQTDEISLSSTYELERMTDFNRAQLVQQPVFDNNAQLVPPWRAPFVFRKGALVAIKAHLAVYHFMGDEKPNHVCFSPCVPTSQGADYLCGSINLLPPGPSSWHPPHWNTSRRAPFPARRWLRLVVICSTSCSAKMHNFA